MKSILSSRLADSSDWVWNHSDFNGNIAGSRLGLHTANTGNDDWQKLPSFFAKYGFKK